MSTFFLPDVGEGLTEADIVSWKVAVGDTVTVNQVLVEIETAKSLVDLPSPFAGVVAKLHAAEGVTLAVEGNTKITVSGTSQIDMPMMRPMRSARPLIPEDTCIQKAEES